MGELHPLLISESAIFSADLPHDDVAAADERLRRRRELYDQGCRPGDWQSDHWPLDGSPEAVAAWFRWAIEQRRFDERFGLAPPILDGMAEPCLGDAHRLADVLVVAGVKHLPPSRPSIVTHEEVIEHLHALLDWVQEVPKVEVAHADDFRSVLWFGTYFEFTAGQAPCVEVLWRHWERGTHGVSEHIILEKSESAGIRLRDVFGKGNHPSWGTMISPAGKGAFKLSATKFQIPR